MVRNQKGKRNDFGGQTNLPPLFSYLLYRQMDNVNLAV